MVTPTQIKKISNNVALFKTMLKKFLLQYVFTVLMNTINKIIMIMIVNKLMYYVLRKTC